MMTTLSSADQELLARPSRQSPVAIAFLAFRILRSINVFQLAVPVYFLLAGPFAGRVLALAGLGLLTWLAASGVSWWRYVFFVDGDELKVNRGLFVLQRTVIPLDRVQSVTIEQKLLHRAIGLVRVEVDTAGSDGAEFVLDAIGSGHAAALQRLAAAYRETGSPIATADGMPAPLRPPDFELIRRTPAELVRIGLSRWPLAGLVVVIPLTFAALDFATNNTIGFEIQAPDFVTETASEAADSVSNATEQGGIRSLLSVEVILGLSALLLVAVLFGWALQIGRSLVTDWNLTISKSPDGLRRNAGLLSRSSQASRLERVQFIEWTRTPMQRVLGISDLTLEVIGERDLEIPGATPAEVDRIKQVVFGSAEGPAPAANRRVSSALAYLAIRNSAIGCGFLLAGFGFLAANNDGGWSWWMYGPLLYFVVGAGTSYRRWRTLRWGLTHRGVSRQGRIVVDRRIDVEHIKTQMVTVRQSPFQWRRNLASVSLVTPQRGVTVPMVSMAEAEQLRDVALYGVESDTRRWM